LKTDLRAQGDVLSRTALNLLLRGHLGLFDRCGVVLMVAGREFLVGSRETIESIKVWCASEEFFRSSAGTYISRLSFRTSSPVSHLSPFKM